MSVTIYEAIELIYKNCPKPKSEIIPLEECTGRVSAKNLTCTISLPSYDNSAMDGFALKLKNQEEKEFKIVGKIFAGDCSDIELKEGEAIKIMTGAKVPKGTNTIIPQENVLLKEENKIEIAKHTKLGANIRKIGEDIFLGDPVLKEGEKINAAHIALLASQGISHVSVYKRPKVTVFASGKELKLHYEKVENFQIYNSNTPTLIARCKELGCESVFIGKAEDSIESIKNMVESSLKSDFIVTSGGVSVGEADFTKEAFKQAGFNELFSKVEIKPGKPTTFGKIEDLPILNLPGNPLACMLNFEIFGKAIIYRLLGLKNFHQSFINTPLLEEIQNKPGRDTVIPGYLSSTGFKPASKHAPGMVNVLNKCNGFIILSRDISKLKAGKTVKFIPIGWDIRSEEFTEFITEL